MKVSVQLFARARELAGRSPVELDVPDNATIELLQCRLVQQFPEIQQVSDSLFWAVNHEYVLGSRQVNDTDQIACFPPVSGG